MRVGDRLGNVVSRKVCGPLDSRESIQYYELGHSEHGMMAPGWGTMSLGREALCVGRLLV